VHSLRINLVAYFQINLLVHFATAITTSEITDMASSTEFDEKGVIIDLYRPVLCPNPAARIHVLLRRAHEHKEAMYSKIRGWTPGNSHAEFAQWLREIEQFTQDKKLRMKLCLVQLEDHVRDHPETPIKCEVEMLQMQYQFFSNVFSDRVTEGTCHVQGS
jgi:hypothetical protein